MYQISNNISQCIKPSVTMYQIPYYIDRTIPNSPCISFLTSLCSHWELRSDDELASTIGACHFSIKIWSLLLLTFSKGEKQMKLTDSNVYFTKSSEGCGGSPSKRKGDAWQFACCLFVICFSNPSVLNFKRVLLKLQHP